MVTTVLMGGLGNQLFQISHLIAHSLRFNVDYCVPLTVDNPHYESQKPYIFKQVNYCNIDLSLPRYNEVVFEYKEIDFVDNVCFFGYYQSASYFSNYKDEILKAFSIPYERKDGTVSVHIRRGDYLQKQNYHPVVTIEYIHKAIKYFQDKGYEKYLIVSDDIDWCYENIQQIGGYEYEFSEGRTELEDLALASGCEHNIGSNSSFSLWIHYLNQNPDKECILPSRWFGDLNQHDTKDLYPEKSILI